jgi:hypothetical protein
MFLANWNLENSIVLKTLRHLMSSGYKTSLVPYEGAICAYTRAIVLRKVILTINC